MGVNLRGLWKSCDVLCVCVSVCLSQVAWLIFEKENGEGSNEVLRKYGDDVFDMLAVPTDARHL
jgi:hypothetical protein